MIKLIYSKNIILFILGIFISINSKCIETKTVANKQLVVVIDPGHGGKDPGAVSKGIKEKDIVLGVGLKLGKLIKDNYPEVSVVFTRNTDVFVPLIERSRIANRVKADLFISIHANYCGTPSIRGTETFVLGLHKSNENLEIAKKENSVILLEENYKTTYEGFDPNLSESYIMFELVQDVFMEQSVSFADEVQNQFRTKLGTPDRSVKQAGFLVLRQASMPGVLVEVGFLSNANEANFMNSNNGQLSIANSIFDAFKKFESKNSGRPIPVAEASTSNKSQNKTETINSAAVKTEKENVKTENKITEVNHSKPAIQKNNFEIDEKKQELPLREAITDNHEKIAEKMAFDSVIPGVEKTKTRANVNENIKTTNTSSDKMISTKPIESKSNENSGKIYYSVQIGASMKDIDATPANFKGVTGIRKEKSDKYFRFFVGNEDSLEKIKPLWLQIRKKIPEAFVVSFENGKRTIISSTIKK